MSDRASEDGRLIIQREGCAHIDAYLEYRRIVGDDDGGRLFTPEEYEEYKKRVLPMRLKNRIYTAWTVPSSGMDCKLIGPETPCFCGHRYKQHKTDFAELPTTRPIELPCSAGGCPCPSYQYVPTGAGSQPVRCKCKHEVSQHSPKRGHVCGACGACSGFRSSYTCPCGRYAYEHEMVAETKAEREARGMPVGRDTPYAAMGGLTGFSSLMDGYARLDPSGAGAPSAAELSEPVSAFDHPFLRANLPAIAAHRRGQAAIAGSSSQDAADLAANMAAMRLPGESEMDYYERRYQERLRQERLAKHGVKAKPKGIETGRDIRTITAGSGASGSHSRPDSHSAAGRAGKGRGGGGR